MVYHLKKAREKQVAAGEKFFLTTDDFKHTLPGLYKRGLVSTKMEVVNGKKFLRIHLTDDGIAFLDRYNIVQ